MENNLNNQKKSVSLYFILMLVIIALMIVPSFLSSRGDSYTRGNLTADIKSGNVIQVVIEPSKQTPTGAVEVYLKNGSTKVMYVTNVSNIEDYVRELGIEPFVDKVEEESYFMTTILPIVICGVMVLFLVMMMNGGGGGSNAKMMNFGKSKARMTTDTKINFQNVAGLKEEREELVVAGAFGGEDVIIQRSHGRRLRR